MPNSLDLTRFYGLDNPRLYANPGALEIIREQFASEITDCAFTCRNNRGLLDALYLAMPPESGLGFPVKIGQGSTRRAYRLPFGLCLKLERNGPLHPTELAYRACSAAYLHERRRVANFAELTTAIAFPKLVVRIYAAALSFGHRPPNPSVIITERLKPLSERDENDLIGIDYGDLAIGSDGTLKVYDRRFNNAPRSRDDRPLKTLIPQRADGLWTGNVGTDASGRFFLLDSGNNTWAPCSLTDDFYPHVAGSPKFWKLCHPNSAEHLEQTILITKSLLKVYEERRKSNGQESTPSHCVSTANRSGATRDRATVHTTSNDELQS